MLVIVPYVFVWRTFVEGRAFPVAAIIIPIALSYAQGTKYLGIWRSDVSGIERWMIYALSPFMTLWQNLFLRPLRLWGALTSGKMGWNTRQPIEVSMEGRLD